MPLCKIVTRDEMGELSEAFNQMTASLKSARIELEEWGKNLEAKVAERTLAIKQMQTQLIRSEKLVSLGRLVAGITHEINNPLTGILMFANLTSDSPKLDPSLKGDVDVIINEAQRCAKNTEEVVAGFFPRVDTAEETDIAQ